MLGVPRGWASKASCRCRGRQSRRILRPRGARRPPLCSSSGSSRLDTPLASLSPRRPQWGAALSAFLSQLLPLRALRRSRRRAAGGRSALRVEGRVELRHTRRPALERVVVPPRSGTISGAEYWMGISSLSRQATAVNMGNNSSASLPARAALESFAFEGAMDL